MANVTQATVAMMARTNQPMMAWGQRLRDAFKSFINSAWAHEGRVQSFEQTAPGIDADFETGVWPAQGCGVKFDEHGALPDLSPGHDQIAAAHDRELSGQVLQLQL